MTRLFAALVPVLVACPIACGGSSPMSPEAAVAHAGDRLRGSWVLAEYRSEEQLEPILASLLAAQIGRLTVVFDGENISAQGVGVTAQRRYTIDNASADQFTATVVDPTGLKYGVTGNFQGPDLFFTSQTAPWRGTGRLRRAE